jgi:hypothetical protein
MHGGATALFAMLGQALTPKMRRGSLVRFLPGLAAAFALHAVFNRFLAYPVASTIVMLIGLAAALGFILSRNRRSIEQVLATDFEAHCKLHHDILWGHFTEGDVASLLESLEVPFNSEELPRIARYIRLHTKLIIYTEALLRARERGGLVQVDETVVEMLDEFRAVEASVGQAARFALNRHLHFSRSESFKLHMLTREAELKAPAVAVDRFALGLDELVD